MKVAILSESPADEAAVRILVEAILQEPVEVVTRRARAGGWKPVFQLIPPVLKELHFRRTADALAIVVDSDNSTVHVPVHDDADVDVGTCRYCAANETIRSTLSNLQPLPGLPAIQTAVAVATPAVEAWYLFGINPDCTEAGWIQRQAGGTTAPNDIRKLKTQVYGSDRRELVDRAIESANRLGADVENFEKYFPNSFGLFANEVRSWVPVN